MSASLPDDWLSGTVQDGLREQLDLAPVGVSDLLLFFGRSAVVAFVVTLVATPIIRRIAIASGIVDRPDAARKLHRAPVAYLGGVAVLLGLLAGILYSTLWPGEGVLSYFGPVPVTVVVGMLSVSLTGLSDDVWTVDPRLKVAGQLVAAALLATNDIGVDIVAGVVNPFLTGDVDVQSPAWDSFSYWLSTAILAVLIIGACNAANLIDGLDGLLTGTTAVSAVGLLVISLMVAVHYLDSSGHTANVTLLATDGSGPRLVLACSLLGATLGFLPYNFNPAKIFLGDCGSLLLGFTVMVIIIMLGHFGQTHLVFAGLIVFSLPIMDTVIAIVRRKLTGRSITSADDQHIHHMLLRAFGSVRKAVLALYGISAVFAGLGIALAYLTLFTDWRVRQIYGIAVLLFIGIAAVTVLAARRSQSVRLARTAEDAAGVARASSPRPSAGSMTVHEDVRDESPESTKRSA